jgi:hypothetical protein
MRVFFRRADRSSASAISALLNSPLEDLATISRHIADNDLPAWNGRAMATPFDLAQPMISSAVRGPQFRAAERSLKRSFRSNSLGGIHLPRGGSFPVISAASSLRTFSARVLNELDRSTGSSVTLFGIREGLFNRAPKSGPCSAVTARAGNSRASWTRPVPARRRHVVCLFAFATFTARAHLAGVKRARWQVPGESTRAEFIITKFNIYRDTI